MTAARAPARRMAAVVGGLITAAVPLALAATGWPAVVVLVGAGLVAVPFALLITPAVLGWHRPTAPVPALPWPDGWRRVQDAGAVGMVALVVVIAVALGDAAIEWRAGVPGAAVAVFGCGLVFAGLSVTNLPRRHRVAVPAAVDVGEGVVGAIGLPASASYPVGVVVAAGGLAVFCTGMALLAQGIGRVVAGSSALLIGVVVVTLAALRGSTGPRLLLSPNVVLLVAGKASWTVPWPAIAAVRAFDATAHGPAGSVRVPFVGLVVDPPEATRVGDGFARRMRAPVRKGDVDIYFPVRSLDVDPLLVYWTLRFYAAHPADRVELGDGRALRRVHGRDLNTPPVPALPHHARPVLLVRPSAADRAVAVRPATPRRGGRSG
jgi:hypothetical protein